MDRQIDRWIDQIDGQIRQMDIYIYILDELCVYIYIDMRLALIRWNWLRLYQVRSGEIRRDEMGLYQNGEHEIGLDKQIDRLYLCA